MFVVAFVCFFNGLRKKRQAGEVGNLLIGAMSAVFFSLPRSRTASIALAVHRLCSSAKSRNA